jgi:hypothetical protein
MISSEKAPPFLEKYITTKREAEEYLLSEECKDLKAAILRPGFIWDKENRSWSVPLKIVCDLFYQMNESVYKKTPLSKQIDFLIPAKSTRLSTVGHFSIDGALGKLSEKIIINDIMIDYEKKNNL